LTNYLLSFFTILFSENFSSVNIQLKFTRFFKLAEILVMPFVTDRS